MSGTQQWPGQEVPQWPGTEVQGGGEYGFRLAPLEEAKPQRVTTMSAETADVPGGGAAGGALTGVGGVTPPPGAVDATRSAWADAANRTGAAIGRIGDAAVEAYQASPPILSPKAQEWVDQTGPIGRWITNPLLHIVGGIPAALSAVGAATGHTAYEVGEGIAPGLGRDLNILAQVAPIVMAPTEPGAPPSVQEAPPTPRFVQEYYGEGTRANPLAALPEPPRPAFVPPGENVAPRPVVEAAPSPPSGPSVPPAGTGGGYGTPMEGGRVMGVGPEPQPAAQPAPPQPSSVGAAASRQGTPLSLIDLTPKEEAAYRSTAEGQKLLEPQPVGQPDLNAYVRGVEPTQAEIEQTVNAAREQKASITAQTAVSDEAKVIAERNNAARQRHFEDIAGSDVTLANAEAARDAQAATDLKATWANKAAADPQPLFDTAQTIKQSPDGRRPLVRRLVDSVTNELTDDNGKLITDPELLYGVRKHIDDLINEQGAAGKPANDRAMANLLELKSTLDGVIEAAAPGFQQYLKNFSDASRPIDEMRVLQKHENKLYAGPNSTMTFSRVQNMMRQIVDSRSAPGINPYKSISDETMGKLWALRDDLRRVASAEDLARARGSDTTQNLVDLARLGGTAVLHTGANLAFGPGLGSMVVQGGKAAMAPFSTRRQIRRGMEMLRPTQYQLKNPLMPD